MATPSKPTGPTPPNPGPGPNPNLGQALGPTPPTTPGAFPLGPNPPNPTGRTPTNPTNRGTTPNLVHITNKGFSPPKVTVKVGDTVTWVNDDTKTHNVSFDGIPTLSTDLLQGEEWTHTVTAAGTHVYHCDHHPEMKGEIIAS